MRLFHVGTATKRKKDINSRRTSLIVHSQLNFHTQNTSKLSEFLVGNGEMLFAWFEQSMSMSWWKAKNYEDAENRSRYISQRQQSLPSSLINHLLFLVFRTTFMDQHERNWNWLGPTPEQMERLIVCCHYHQRAVHAIFCLHLLCNKIWFFRKNVYN